MKLRYWMAAKSIVEILFGIGFVIAPVFVGTIFGMDLDESGALMAQLFGTLFIFGSIVLWLSQKAQETEPAVRAIVIAVVISNVIGFVLTLLASLNGVWNALGWIPVALFLVFALGFTYFLFAKPAPRK